MGTQVIRVQHRMGTSTEVLNVVVDVLSRNPVDNMDGSQISSAALRGLALNSREQLIREQREDPEPQANLTERVNRNLVQMIACFVKENHENWN
ncbi:hypothetical protein TNCV_3268901 [Trichonephila clavipes]|nr:hypothetical protein TNCV_3268901 [Trichonephila clavipes]